MDTISSLAYRGVVNDYSSFFRMAGLSLEEVCLFWQYLSRYKGTTKRWTCKEGQEMVLTKPGLLLVIAA